MCPLKSHRIDSPYRKCSRSLEDHGTPPEDCGGVRRHAAEPSRDPVAKKMLCVSITPFPFSGAQKDGSSLPLLATGIQVDHLSLAFERDNNEPSKMYLRLFLLVSIPAHSAPSGRQPCTYTACSWGGGGRSLQSQLTSRHICARVEQNDTFT